MLKRIVFYSFFVFIGLESCFCAVRPQFSDWMDTSFDAGAFKRVLAEIVESVPDQVEYFLDGQLRKFLTKESESIEGVSCVVDAYATHLPPEKIYSILKNPDLRLIAYASDRLNFYSEQQAVNRTMFLTPVLTRKRSEAQLLFNNLFSYLSYALVCAAELLSVDDVKIFLSLGARPDLVLDHAGKRMSAVDCIKNIISNSDKGRHSRFDIYIANKILDEFQLVINNSLFSAIGRGDVERVSSLLAAGADVLFKNEHHLMAIDFAKYRYNHFKRSVTCEKIFNMMVEHIRRKDASHKEFWSVAGSDQIIAPGQNYLTPVSCL